jgi:hypothetical protein
LDQAACPGRIDVRESSSRRRKARSS